MKGGSMIGVNRRRVMGGHDEIIMTSETNPEVLAVCYARGWAKHADYMTKREAEAVTSLPERLFANNQNMGGFNEFVYFTNPLLTSVPRYCFNGSSLQSIVLPSQITTISTDSFRATTIEEAILNEGLVTINRSFYSVPQLDNLCIPSTVTNIGNGLLYRATACRALIMKPVSPPTATRLDMFSYCTAKIYVPDNSVNDYKAADVWSSFENRIYGFSQLLIDYPDLYEKYIA
jgi:hypothetical protein